MKASKFSVLFYEEKSLPRYLQIGPRPLRFLIFGLPLITILALAVAAVVGHQLYQSRHAGQSSENRAIRQLQQEVAQAQKAREQALGEVRILQERLNQDAPGETLTTAALIHPVKGQQDLTKQKLITLENIKVTAEERGIKIDFVMAKTDHPEQTLAGHIIIVLQQGNQLHFYPANILNQQMQINYNSGETFSFGRLRPVSAVFAPATDVKNSRFKIFIFSRNGDLVLEQLYTPSSMAN